MASSIGARGYFETSALTNQGVDQVFESATRSAVLVRDQGHGGVGAAYDKDGNDAKQHAGRRREKKKEKGVGKCCIVM